MLKKKLIAKIPRHLTEEFWRLYTQYLIFWGYYSKDAFKKAFPEVKRKKLSCDFYLSQSGVMHYFSPGDNDLVMVSKRFPTGRK